ncbi:head-tail connector protein [Tateyamaria sp. SN3-11]|uniref:head-tail connector protein n=1 Tax=Tateyamaria sp. SN3-11 TaxID=3092147 RepID=UPI0039ED8FAD
MAQTSLTQLKNQLNIQHDLDDALLTQKLSVAESWITRNIGSAFDVNEPIHVEVALMLAAYWYEQREAASFGMTTAPVPFGVHALLQSYRESVVGHVA